MRLSSSESALLAGKNKILKSSRSKKKHKRLDAICEKIYTKNHNGVDKVEVNEGDVGGNENEPRRSTRVRKAPEVLDASPMPPKKRRRVDKRVGLSGVRKGKRVVWFKNANFGSNSKCSDSEEEDLDGYRLRLRTSGRYASVGGRDKGVCSNSEYLEAGEENMDGWRSRLRARGKCASSGGREKGVYSTSKYLEVGEENLEQWRARLRTRAKHQARGEKEGEDFSPKGRKKLFEDFDEMKEETALGIQESDDEEEERSSAEEERSSAEEERSSAEEERSSSGEETELGTQGSDQEEVFVKGRSSTAKFKSIERVKVLSGLENEDKEIGFGDGMEEDEEVNKEVASGSFDEENSLLLKNGIESATSDESKVDLGPSHLVEKKEMEIQGGLNLEEHESHDNAKMQLEDQACINVEGQISAVEVDGATEDLPKVSEILDKPLEAESSGKLEEKKHSSDCTQRPIRIKGGRRCGLCGGGTDGKPPKRLVQDVFGSDNEACSGGSASEEPNYDVWDGFGNEPSWLGRLLGPVNDKFGIAGIWVHQQCAVWSPEVYFAGLGCLKNVRAALYRGRVLKCSRCGRPGATIGCRVDRCPKTYHLPCARDSGCIFDHRKFLIACTDHRHIFQPLGSQYLHRLKKMKVRKMRLEVRKVSNDALRKDIEAEEKWLEHCGEDEEFLKRESKRLHRDLLRIAPTYIGGSSSNNEMQFRGWESVAGLHDVIQCMKEVVILPLLYPELFSSLGLTPPRGVLLHGYPGTGKTLVVRALIGACARGDQRIAYFARKGADCLGKYVGDAERQLRLLFQVAEKSQPSIIFFDEIDGLAPCRTRQQDQTHSSVVSTLLALMDGLKSRGSVVVIGATNRPDAVDPALRRPGRFDREIYFPLPSVNDREAILSLHTQKWPKQISGSLLKWIARRTVGFAGADLQALCTQAAIIALRRNFPLQEILAGSGENALLRKRPLLPYFTVEERDWLDALSLAPPPCSQREAGIAANDVIASPLAAHLVPCLLQPLSKLLVSLYLDERIWLPLPICKAVTLIKNAIVSTLLEKKLLGDEWWVHLHDLLLESDILKKIEDELLPTAIFADAFGSSDPLEDVVDDRCLMFKPSRVQRVGAHPSLPRTISCESELKCGFRMLISGEPRSGQRHLSSCLLHCFSGNIEIRKLDLATLSQEGHGDVVQGLTLILMRCVTVGSCILFLPRIDLWAMEMCTQEHTASPSSSSSAIGGVAENFESEKVVKIASYLWNSFIEQVEPICVRTPLMILATSEVPFMNLPSRVKQFFRCDILDSGLLAPSKGMMPRFSVEIDGNLNPHAVTDTSAAKLLVDLVRYFIHWVRHDVHANTSGEKNSSYVAEPIADAVKSRTEPESAIEGESKHLIAPFASAPVHNHVKGKSSLLTAISTFGYQILRYPHFAELCWVTSKLKEGPCTCINGPWKGWPFNSCIALPSNSKEGVVVPSTSNAAKNMDKSCVVRGLIAVGLSAYRGEYTSLRAFSLEIQKVLELLVGLVDAKIQAGKDKFKFFRLLSQVAYFEDMVISWAYALRSLEVDAHLLDGSPQPISTGSLSSVPEAGLKENISNGNLCESEMLEQIAQEVNAKDSGVHAVADDDLNVQNELNEIGVAPEDDLDLQSRANENGTAHEKVSVPRILDNSTSAVKIQSPLPNGSIAETTSIPIEAKNRAEVDGHLEGSKHFNNGCLQCVSSVVVEDGHHLSGNNCGMELSNSQITCDPDNAVLLIANGEESLDTATEHSLGCSSRMSSGSNVSGLLCMYHCCSPCLVNLYQILLKLLNYELGLKGSSMTVEDFHDTVASLSIGLQSAVRRLFSKDGSRKTSDEEQMQRKCRKYTQCTQMCISRRTNTSKGLVVPAECACHSEGDGSTTEGEFLNNSRHGFDEMKFFFRDGVLVGTLDTDPSAPLHCKFEKLCLCSLVECIVTSKDSLD